MGKQNRGWRTAGLVLALSLGVLLTCQTADAQKTKGKTRPTETKYLMRGISQPNCAALAGLVKAAGTGDDKVWEQITQHATLLNELGYLLMDDGRCPDKEWAGAAKTLRECSVKVLDAAKAKDLKEAQTTVKTLTGACAACHKAHRPKQ